MNTFGLSIVASDKVFFRGRGINIVIPAQDGQVSILAHHADDYGCSWGDAFPDRR